MRRYAEGMFLKIVKWAALAAVLIQFIPYGRNHTNPSKTSEPAWNSAGTRALMRRACFDCHSNETIWPWYSHVAPASWLVQNDVDGGRSNLNLTEWNRPQRHAADVATEIQQGDMPPWYYLPMHPAARLSGAEKQALIDAAAKTFGPQKPPEAH